MLDGQEWRRLFHDVWVHAAVPDTREIRLAVVALVLPAYAVICGPTAAWLYGADVRRRDDLDIHVSFPKGRRRRRQQGLVVTQETLAVADVWEIRGIHVTSPVRTAFDCLRFLNRMEAVVAADALTQLRRTTLEELESYFASRRGLRNLRIGRRRLDLVDPGAESPMESRMRLRLIDFGLPAPVTQFEVRTPSGAFVARLDLAYPDCKVAVEYDGAWHFARRREDDRRRDAARALGWIVLVFSADDVYGSPEAMCSAVAAARRRATSSSATSATF
jgi:very-short-patch-repair endonuclease